MSLPALERGLRELLRARGINSLAPTQRLARDLNLLALGLRQVHYHTRTLLTLSVAQAC